MNGEEGTKRKTRSDKKRDIKPTITSDLYECISRLSYITDRPIKDVGEAVCMKGLVSEKVIESISPNFKRDYWLNENRMFKGHGQMTHSRILRVYGEKRRIKIRLDQSTYDKLSDLAHSLDFTISSACSLLLEMSSLDPEIIQAFMDDYIDNNLDEQRKKQLRKVLKFINKHSPYEEDLSLLDLLNFIIEDFRKGTENIKATVDQYLKNFIDY